MTWRTRKDPFEGVWSQIQLQLEINPERTAKGLLKDLVSEKPEQFNMSLLRTLQRRVAQWRMLQIKMYQENHHQQTCYPEDIISKFVSLATHAIT